MENGYTDEPKFTTSEEVSQVDYALFAPCTDQAQKTLPSGFLQAVPFTLLDLGQLQQATWHSIFGLICLHFDPDMRICHIEYSTPTFQISVPHSCLFCLE